MQRALLLLLLLFAVRAHGQDDRVISYPSGMPKYIITYARGTMCANIYLGVMGDTIYKWDTRTASMTEYPSNGEYLTRREYDSVKRAGSIHSISPEKGLQVANSIEQPIPDPQEWRTMHDVFYKLSPRYTLYLRQGPFTIEVTYRDNVRAGPFKKYYGDKLVISGNFKNDVAKGFWHFYPYHFYPYYDITFANPFYYDFTFYDPYGKHWSLIYYILPVVLGVILLVFFWKLAVRKDRYNRYYYTVLTLAIIAIILRLGIPFRRDIITIRFLIPAMWLVLWHGMLFLTTMNLFIGKRTNTRTFQNVALLLIGLGCSIYVLFFKYLTF